jgi:iron complex outermembrane recepter protein
MILFHFIKEGGEVLKSRTKKSLRLFFAVFIPFVFGMAFNANDPAGSNVGEQGQIVSQSASQVSAETATPPAATSDQTSRKTQDPAAPLQGPEMVVTAPRMDVPYKKVPGAITVIGQDILEAMPKAISPGEALALVPGVKVDTQYDSEQSHISIRGQGILTELGLRGIMVLLDGIPLNDPTGFAPDMFDVDWSVVKSVEVIRGPSGALYGGGSSAGVINIITKDGRTDPDLADLSGSAGTNGFWKASGEFSGKSDAMDYRFSASRSMGDGNRVHSAFFSTNIDGKMRFILTPSFELTAILMGTAYFNENPEGLNTDQIREDPFQPNPDSQRQNEYRYTRRLTGGIIGKLRLADNQDLSFTAYDRKTEYTESVPSSLEYRNSRNPGAMVQYTLRTESGAVKNRFSLGADAGWQSIDDWKHPNLGHGHPGEDYLSRENITQHGYGFYALDLIDFGNNWGTFLNLRHDSVHNNLDDRLKLGGVDLSGAKGWNNTTGRVGVTWNPKSDLGFYATWGQGFLPPGTNEILANPVHQGGLNQAILPAASTGEELGVRGFVTKVFAYDLCGFYMNTKNDFERYRVESRPLETFYGNAGRTKRYGLESSFGWFPSEQFTARLAYTYNHFTYTEYNSKTFTGDLKGHFLPNSPKNQGYLDLEYRPWTGWFFGLSDEMQSRNYVDPTNIPLTGGYSLVHARAGYRWQGLKTRGEFTVVLRNAFDKMYIAFTEPDPDGNSYQAGPGREWFMGIHFWFGKK